MNAKTKKTILACLFGGLVAVLLLHQGLELLKQPQLLTSQLPWTTQTQVMVNKDCPQGMAYVEGGTFRMGSDEHYMEERSVKNVTVTGFCMDEYEVTNAEFARFVEETGYVTVAERPLSAEQYPNLSEAQRAPGSLVFVAPKEKKQIREGSWWHWVPGANWQHPTGPDSNLENKDNYPVVHIAYEDALAYSKWAGKSLPTEAEWEFAARGGLKNTIFSWGNEYSPKNANTWQGLFPFQNTETDGYIGTAPVGSFPANGYGLYDITGNVWEWTQDWYRIGHEGKAGQVDPVVSNPEESFDPREPGVAKHAIKGGSYLCAPNYCSRYRPAAREAQAPDTGTSHIGFRLVKIDGVS